jgi:hypothetical protein
MLPLCYELSLGGPFYPLEDGTRLPAYMRFGVEELD